MSLAEEALSLLLALSKPMVLHLHFFCRDTGLIRTPTTVVGGYYFGAYLQSHTWFRPPDPQRFRSLPFCLPGGKRTIQVSRLSNLDGVDESKGVGRYNMAAVHSRGHLLTRDDESGLTIKVYEWTTKHNLLLRSIK